MLKNKISFGLLFLNSKRVSSNQSLNEFKSLQDYLNKKSITFPVAADQIEILNEPQSFFNKLKVII